MEAKEKGGASLETLNRQNEKSEEDSGSQAAKFLMGIYALTYTPATY